MQTTHNYSLCINSKLKSLQISVFTRKNFFK